MRLFIKATLALSFAVLCVPAMAAHAHHHKHRQAAAHKAPAKPLDLTLHTPPATYNVVPASVTERPHTAEGWAALYASHNQSVFNTHHKRNFNDDVNDTISDLSGEMGVHLKGLRINAHRLTFDYSPLHNGVWRKMRLRFNLRERHHSYLRHGQKASDGYLEGGIGLKIPF